MKFHCIPTNIVSFIDKIESKYIFVIVDNEPRKVGDFYVTEGFTGKKNIFKWSESQNEFYPYEIGKIVASNSKILTPNFLLEDNEFYFMLETIINKLETIINKKHGCGTKQ